MNILLVHNHYRQPGGEDSVFFSEKMLLSDQGHNVFFYTANNAQLEKFSAAGMIRNTLWNQKSYWDLRYLISKHSVQVAHFHNTFPLISPSAYYAAKSENIPVVQTLHNYRLLCPNALFFRAGHVCEDCLGRFVPWPGVLRRCYRGSIAASGVVATMLTFHRVLGTWKRMVDVYVALTEFARQKFIKAGFPAEKIVVKPNFVYPDPGVGEGKAGFTLFVGRLSPEKGLDTLLVAWERLEGKLPLKIVGDGPLAGKVIEATQRLIGVEWLGRRSREEVLALMKEASFLIFPSISHEGFPMTIVEAFAVGLPVLASNIGNMSNLIDPGRTGFHFRAGDSEDLAAKVEWAWAHTRQLMEMRREARAEYEAKYTAEKNYEMLMNIYQLAISRAKGRG
ncbi:glycosyltransferase family 4 protein [Thermosediminibacter oceani]|uniref:Glycosyl transferase group 1 n=1 Tax=Thermosediminibacter oceani (strain ATCC BAA-1034 / DSM 16646 / JW/IW-1228P) TaxID=555079 RepID=D9S1K7_THEOJ|nr:glycosyltransferase family 4 protein [Thermosediminibacter oceani]ADL07284.1 glycosyl transferase group 1 [Thermosediminibacter oceani DSM 16646]